MRARHILICGERQVGKSTLIQKLLERCVLPKYGFFTKMDRDESDGPYPIYIYRADDTQRLRTKENLVGRCGRGLRVTNSGVFNTLGVDFLCFDPGGVLVLDELGFMETTSPAFCAAVSSALNSELPLLAAVKDRFDVDFLNEVRANPNCEVFRIDECNRNALYDELLPLILEWNKTFAQQPKPQNLQSS